VTDDDQPDAPTIDPAASPAGPDPSRPAVDIAPPAGPVTQPGDPAAPVPPHKPAMPEYKGDELDAERGPGLGCFWLQVILLGVFIVITPLTVKLGWPPIVSAILLFVTLGLLLFVGQTVIFLLRIVAAERRGRRRPVASATRTVGEIEDAASAATAEPDAASSATAEPDATPPAPHGPGSAGGVRQ
jgi:hypothetical protein